MTPSRRFQLEYALDGVGAGGVRQVELWGTTDGGQTWSAWQQDPDRQSPVEVEVNQDGLYGFHVVIVANNGLAGPAPRNGEAADVWVAVDSTPPQLRLTSAIYGHGDRTGQLEIRWLAEDRWLAERPVTLMYSDRPDGPWTTIAAGGPTSGQFYWQVEPRVPRQVYLRIEVQGRVGNASHDQVTEPVSLHGLVPSARIRSIRPM
jgi:hypothetical protein